MTGDTSSSAGEFEHADVDALVDVMIGLSRFAWAYRHAIEEIDLNPVLVHPQGQGVTVVDALIVQSK